MNGTIDAHVAEPLFVGRFLEQQSFLHPATPIYVSDDVSDDLETYIPISDGPKEPFIMNPGLRTAG